MSRLELEVLSPVHIGGGFLLSPGRLVWRDDRIRVLDEAMLYRRIRAAASADPDLGSRIARREAERCAASARRTRPAPRTAEQIVAELERSRDRLADLEGRKSVHFGEFKEMAECRTTIARLEKELEARRAEEAAGPSETADAPGEPVPGDPLHHLLFEKDCSLVEAAGYLDGGERILADDSLSAWEMECRERVPEGAAIHGCARDGRGDPLVPGSSVKGVLRTLLVGKLLAGPDRPGSPVSRALRRSSIHMLVALRSREVKDFLAGKGATASRQALQEALVSAEFSSAFGVRIAAEDVETVLDLWRVHYFDEGDPEVFRTKLFGGIDACGELAISRLGDAVASETLGGGPSGNLARFVRVADSTVGGDEPRTSVRAACIYYIGKDQPRSGVEYLECLEPGRRLELEIAVSGSELSIEGLFAAANETSRAYCNAEAGRARSHLKNSPYERFYRQRAEELKDPAEGTALVRLGGRVGWDAVTVANRLGEDALARLRARLRLGKSNPQLPFPFTRQITMAGGKPDLPFGWVRLKLLD